MSPERSSAPMSPQEQALTPRMLEPMEISSIDVQEAENINGIVQSSTPLTNDDDLTSLAWLQDRNLLKGMNLSKTESDAASEASEQSTMKRTDLLPNQSPTSDYVDESSASAADSSSSSLNSPVPYPNFTPRNKHPHNVPYDPMVHTTSKPPYSFSCLIFMAIEDSPQKALPVKDIYAWILNHFPYFKNAPTGWKNSVRHNLSLNKCFQKVEKAPNLGKGSLWMVDQQFRPNLLQALTRSPFHPCSTLDPCAYYSLPRSSHITNQESKQPPRLPNPELFPYLSKRLAASEIKTETSDDSLDAMDAANVMLALKHGPRLLKDRRRRSKTNSGTDMVQVITTSPSEDHTYSAATSYGSGSPDEAFESDESQSAPTYNHFSYASTEDLEEQRKIAEGADALLNLAGVPTVRKRQTSESIYNQTPKRRRPYSSFSPENEPIPHENDSRPSQFRPRLLRAKRKSDNQKRNNKNINNNNNNTILKKAKNGDSSPLHEEWVKHRKAIEESNRNLR